LDSKKHINFPLKSPFEGGRPRHAKRRNAKKKDKGGAGGNEDGD